MKNDEKNPWKTLASQKVYENPWISVREDQVIHHSGNEGIYGVVHFKNRAIAIVPIDEELNIWLVGQYRYALEEYAWEVPMGGGPKNESLLDSAKRELLEETGIKAKKWDILMKLHPSNSVTDEEGYVFLAQELSFHNPNPDETEELKVEKLPFKVALEMVLNNEITDAISVAAILRVAYDLSVRV